jgi:Na+/melibiose symporter-like transporter
VHQETGARPWLLVVAIVSTVVVLATFAVTTLVEEPGTAVALVAILLLSVLLDLGWKRSADAHAVGR